MESPFKENISLEDFLFFRSQKLKGEKQNLILKLESIKSFTGSVKEFSQIGLQAPG